MKIHPSIVLRPNARRVLALRFRPAVEPRDRNPIDRSRVNNIVDRIVALPTEAVEQELAEVTSRFADRHAGFFDRLDMRTAEMEFAMEPHAVLSVSQRRLVGSYFLHEYSFESAALFNPSIVPHPDQTGVPIGSVRFILSLRGVGEGHISSLMFRTGIVDDDANITLDPKGSHAQQPRIRARTPVPLGDEVDAVFQPDVPLQERILFPITEAQRNGIEDARFVAFDAGGTRRYFATYTAYSGRGIRSELLETSDFESFRMTPLNGTAAHNKGMALFPCLIRGRYAMIGRHDNENLHLIYSDDLYNWNDGQAILHPRYPWEFVQLGNCGSPVDIGDYWLLLTHGVGAMRRYVIGAVLLDKDDPSRVVARSREPLLQSISPDREGYVPNVVYTCGAMRHGRWLVLPYGVADTYTRFATLDIAALAETLLS
jgi:predicted GH43/DUF377 family glycosyl hydrolase